MTAALLQSRMEVVRRWRQAAAWAPIFWFPWALYLLLTERVWASLTFFLSGLIFAGVARLVVATRHCPSCEIRFGMSGAAFKRAWHDSSCEACGLSLFELRRGQTPLNGSREQSDV